MVGMVCPTPRHIQAAVWLQHIHGVETLPLALVEALYDTG